MLIGAVLLGGVDAFNAADPVQAKHFFDPVHQRIWWGMEKLVEQGRVLGPETVAAFFESTPDLNVGHYISNLQASTIGLSGIPAWAREVVEHWQWREVLTIARNLQEEAQQDGPSAGVATVISEAQRHFDALTVSDPHGGGATINEVLDSTLEEIDAASAADAPMLGTSSGIDGLDRVLGGYMPGNLIVMAGRPGMGKSALSAYGAMKVAASGKPVAFFSIEMPREDLARRWLSAVVGVPYDAIRRGEVDMLGREAIAEAAARWREMPLYVDDSPRQAVPQMRARCRRFADKVGKPLALVVVDYMQLVRPEGTYRGQRVHEMSEISAALRGLAKDMDCPVVALSQLNRGVEQRDDKRPHLSDLRDSGSIEQDADAVLMLYRHHYYMSREEPEQERDGWLADLAACENDIEIIVAKNRHGATQTVKAWCDMKLAKFR